MRKVKIICIEYILWLYALACASWLINKLFELSIPGIAVLVAPFVVAVTVSFLRGSVGDKLAPGRDDNDVRRHNLWKYETAIGIILSLVMGWVIVEVKPIAFFTQANNTYSIVSGLFNPNPAQLVPMLNALIETIFLALLATVFAIPFAFFLSFFAAKNLMYDTLHGRIIYIFIRTISTVFRSIEAIVWAIVFCVWVGIGPFAGMLALWIHSIASLIKLYSEQIENIDPGPVEAIRATGASTLQIWRYAVAPQILAPYLAFTIYRWDINVRMATIVGFVGGGGIGLALYQQQQMLAWRNVGLIVWLIALVVWVMDMFSGYIREKLVTN
ncbi:MAG: phosphonate ABC transporter, permease protein PhnE [Candidatus Cloacimonetes bacterium HGW-Cloacimonetes-1]|jgi:phosphonate transport system permease protein|nr:MAG: phosphonate ABC transporter, permease protein PhnE [Candidatus Cloacimonetes bacterium HGW-Cloacimonetes-1]